MRNLLTKSLLAIAVTATISVSAQAADRIGVTIYKYDDNFMSIMRKALEEIAEEQGSLELLMNDSQNNQSMQNDQVDIMLAKGVKALAINLVDPAAGGTIITKAKSAGIPVVFFNKDPGQAAIDSYDQAYFVGTDPVQSGVIQGELITESWKANPDWDLNGDGKIQYALLKGEPGHPDAEARTEWVIKTLNEQGIDTDQLYLDAALWDTAKAKDMAQAWLSGPNADKIEMIIANNDAMAMGANEAAKAQNRKLPIFGVDALPEALQLIKKGEITGTVLNDAQGQAEAIYDITANLAAGKDAVEGTNYQLDNGYLRVPYVGVDENNLDDFLSN